MRPTHKSVTKYLVGIAVLTLLSSIPAYSQNLLANGTFDTNLSKWSSGNFQASWSSTDAEGKAGSGSAMVTHSLPEVSGGPFLSSECVPVVAGETYDYFSKLWLPLNQTGGRISSWIYLYRTPNCQDGGTTVANTDTTTFNTTDGWMQHLEKFTVPAGFVAARASLGAAKDESSGVVVAFADDIELCIEDTCDDIPDTTEPLCTPDQETACLLGGRFEVSVTWGDFERNNGSGVVMSFEGSRAESDQSAFFWFFSPTNFEMGVKMVDACDSTFNSFWFFVSGLTNVRYTATVRDTITGNQRTYSNSLGQLSVTVADTAALPCS